MRVLLVCQPPLLHEVVAMALGQLADVELVREAGPDVDLVLVTGPVAGADWTPDLSVCRGSRVRLVALDPVSNRLRVLASQHGGTTEWVLPGRLETLVELVRAWASELAGRRAPSLSSGQHHRHLF